MPTLAILQAQLMRVLQGGPLDAFATHVTAQGKIDILQRIEIYRNAYQMRLKECVETDHQILAYYLGDELFLKMVDAYISSYPSQQTSLRYFCDALPEFLAETEPFNAHPVIAELAQFERTLLNAFDAPDAETATLDSLQKIQAQGWPTMRVNLHPSVQFFKSHWNCVPIWQALKQKQAPPNADSLQKSWLIWRNQQRLTEFISLDSAEFIMLEGMLNGLDFSHLCESLTEFVAIEQVSEVAVNCLMKWINSGIISSFDIFAIVE